MAIHTKVDLNPGDTLIIASHNAGKVREIASLLEPLKLNILSAGELGIEEPEETGTTFVENSQLKARAIAHASGKLALADDSGMYVDALNGEPGIYAGRWAEITPGGPRDFKFAFKRIFDALVEVKAEAPYRAKMVCVLSLADPQGNVQSYEGIIEGELSLPPRGDHGFGYDPIFTPDGHAQTFAQMGPILKHQISHRKRAFDLFLKNFKEVL